MKHDKKHEESSADAARMSRRDFLKMTGAAGAAVAGLAAGCKPDAAKAAGGAAGAAAPGEMTLRTNPKSGDRVSLLGYGCMRWPSVEGGSGRDQNAPLDQAAVNRLVDHALANGVNYFDTAPPYCRGQSETATGIALARHPRDSYFLATKLSNFSEASQSREGSIAMYRNSFKVLQTDYFDYYLLHNVGRGGMDEFRKRYLDNGIIDFVAEEREAGRIRNLGFSFHGDIRVFDYLLSQHDKYHWDFVQIQLNYLDWQHAQEINRMNTDAEYLYGELVKRNIPAVIMEPLLGGRLAKVHDHIAARLQQREPEHSIASWAFRFAGSFPNVLTVLSGMTYMEHLQENLRTYSPLQPLTDEELRFLLDTATLMMQYPAIPCNDCKYCMPCPYGIDIPAVLLHYNRCINEGYIQPNAQSPDFRRARRAFLALYDRGIPAPRQAEHCIGCNTCVHHCPQSIDIPKELHRIDQYVETLKRSL